MEVLVTGSSGFIGKNLLERLSRIENIKIHTFDIEDKLEDLEKKIDKIDFIFHLAGVNRPQNIDEFYKGNRDIIKDLISIIEKKELKIPILVTSSIQVERDNDYGKSKLEGENLLREYSIKNNAPIYIYRLPNVFGKWCKPNYNSVIATWCSNIASDLGITVSDKAVKLSLVYIDDVVNIFSKHLTEKIESKEYYLIPIIYEKTLGEILDLLYSFKNNRNTLIINKVGTGFEVDIENCPLSKVFIISTKAPLLSLCSVNS